jgi:hypothetical protein
VCVIGGGISGCGSAAFLREMMAPEDLEISVLEAGSILGGRVGLVDFDGRKYEVIPHGQTTIPTLQFWIRAAAISTISAANPLHPLISYKDTGGLALVHSSALPIAPYPHDLPPRPMTPLPHYPHCPQHVKSQTLNFWCPPSRPVHQFCTTSMSTRSRSPSSTSSR